MKLKRSTEDYLKIIYILSRQREVHGADIAEELGVSRPTVSIALKALESEGYITRDDSHAICLTEEGLDIAKSTYERHQTFQTMLESLGVDHETAAADACLMEHAVSPESFRALKGLAEGTVNGRE
jgi:DtxR family Mn-dependent transcriptional regulator